MKFANYPGTGRIVAVILRTMTSSAAYTPTLSYGCYPEATDNEDDEEDSCEALSKSSQHSIKLYALYSST